MIQISDNTQQIQPSKIRRMFNKALEYDRVLSFTPVSYTHLTLPTN